MENKLISGVLEVGLTNSSLMLYTRIINLYMVLSSTRRYQQT